MWICVSRSLSTSNTIAESQQRCSICSFGCGEDSGKGSKVVGYGMLISTSGSFVGALLRIRLDLAGCIYGANVTLMTKDGSSS